MQGFEKVVGKLRHAAIGIPAGRGLFRPLNEVIKRKPDFVWLRKRSAVRLALTKWQTRIAIVAEEPIQYAQLVPGDPDYILFVDAPGEGAGGVVFGGKKPLQPTVFRFPFPASISTEVVSDKNPKGSLTNLDLEMVATVLE